MTVTNRKDARNALVTLITTNMTGAGQLNAVYDHLPKDFQGKSPVCAVSSGSAFYQWLPEHVNDFVLMAMIAVRRDDAAASEDLADDMAQDLAEIIYGWDNAEFTGASDVFYEMIDSDEYRFEVFPIGLDWQG